MCRPRFLVLLSLSCFLLIGCPARWKVVFINGSDQRMMVELSGALEGSRRAFTLSPGHSHSERLEQVNRVAVFDGAGAKLFERENFRAKEWSGKYPNIYVLLTATNAYVIPPDYRDTWREHFGKFTQMN
jgi:hypothetical protein